MVQLIFADPSFVNCVHHPPRHTQATPTPWSCSKLGQVELFITTGEGEELVREDEAGVRPPLEPQHQSWCQDRAKQKAGGGRGERQTQEEAEMSRRPSNSPVGPVLISGSQTWNLGPTWNTWMFPPGLLLHQASIIWPHLSSHLNFWQLPSHKPWVPAHGWFIHTLNVLRTPPSPPPKLLPLLRNTYPCILCLETTFSLRPR